MPGVKTGMAFSFDSRLFFDSHMAVCALLLFAASALAWMLSPGKGASLRLNLRFGAILFAALAVAAFAAALWPGAFAGMASAVSLLVASLGSVALGLSVFAHLSRRPPAWAASLALALGLGAGLAAALSGQGVFALAAVIVSASVMLVLGFGCLSRAPLQAAETILAALAFVGGAMALMQNAGAAALLFFAAGLMGLACASQMRVEQAAGRGRVAAVGRARL